MKLISGPLSMYGAKAQIAELEKNFGAEVELVGFNLKDRYEPKHPEVIRINPKQQVPVLIHDGFDLFDSTQIFEYFEDIKPEPALWPKDLKQRAIARQLELTSDEIFFIKVASLMPVSRSKQSTEELAATYASVNQYISNMNDRLKDNDYLVGDFSYADIAFFVALYFSRFLKVRIPEELTHLFAWRARMTKRDSVYQVMSTMGAFITSLGLEAPPLD
ncbi:MAG: glutathione S-transferase family protein [Gammaproteobacteria bacterium]|nr:glutathione S-transferase family protein [Gammaproteobacteria bacterium]